MENLIKELVSSPYTQQVLSKGKLQPADEAHFNEGAAYKGELTEEAILSLTAFINHGRAINIERFKGVVQFKDQDLDFTIAAIDAHGNFYGIDREGKLGKNLPVEFITDESIESFKVTGTFAILELEAVRIIKEQLSLALDGHISEEQALTTASLAYKRLKGYRLSHHLEQSMLEEIVTRLYLSEPVHLFSPQQLNLTNTIKAALGNNFYPASIIEGYLAKQPMYTNVYSEVISAILNRTDTEDLVLYGKPL